MSSYAERRAACMQAAKAYDWPGASQKYFELYNAVTGATVRPILDVPVQVQSFGAAVEGIDARYARCEPVAIAFANAHTLNVAAESAAFRAALQNFLVFNDGIGVDIVSRLLYERRSPKISMARISDRTTCGQRGIATGSSCWARSQAPPSGRHSSLPRSARSMSSSVVIMAISIATRFRS